MSLNNLIINRLRVEARRPLGRWQEVQWEKMLTYTRVVAVDISLLVG